MTGLYRLKVIYSDQDVYIKSLWLVILKDLKVGQTAEESDGDKKKGENNSII